MDAPREDGNDASTLKGCVYPLSTTYSAYRSLAASWLNWFVVLLSTSFIALWLLPIKPNLEIAFLALPVAAFLCSTLLHLRELHHHRKLAAIAINNDELVGPFRFRTRIKIDAIDVIYAEKNSIFIKPENGFTRTITNNIVENQEAFRELEGAIYEQLGPDAKMRSEQTAQLAKEQRKTPAVSVLLIFSLLFLYLALPQEQLIEAVALDRPLIWSGEIFRLVTYSIAHLNSSHLLTNCIGLAVLGAALEGILGKARYFTVYSFGVLGGGFLTFLVGNENYFTVGASGGVFGLLGAGLFLVFDSRFPLPPNTFRFPPYFVAIIVLMALLPVLPGTDGVAHFGGFMAGLGTTWFLFRHFNRPEELAQADLKAAVTSTFAFLILYVPSVVVLLVTS